MFSTGETGFQTIETPGPEVDDLADPRLPAGTVVGGYRLCGELGGGTSCRVYLAEHTGLGRQVALKILRPAFARFPRLVQRFVIEALAVNRVSNPHIIEVTDIGDAPAGPYIVMELLDGEPLDVVLLRGPLPQARALKIAIQLTDAMRAAHAADIIHRDLKPANIFIVDRDGEDFVKVIDFGVAKVAPLSRAAGGETETVPGTILGSPAYMSPEQVRGEGVDLRSDIYALGVVLYEMCSATRPFTGATLREVLGGHVWHPARPLGELRPDLDPELEALVMRCLAREATERPASMGEVHQALQQIAAVAEAVEPAAVEPAAVEPAAVESAAVEPAAVESAAVESAAVEPAAVEPDIEAVIDPHAYRAVPKSRRWIYGAALAGLLCFAGLSFALSGNPSKRLELPPRAPRPVAVPPGAQAVCAPATAGELFGPPAPPSRQARRAKPRRVRRSRREGGRRSEIKRPVTRSTTIDPFARGR